MSDNKQRPIEILLIEDNPGDILLTQEALNESTIKNNLHVAMDGEAGLEFLKLGSSNSEAIVPDLILLDLNMPKKDGRDVLKEIKSDDKLKLIPVIILTTSDAHKDIRKSYELHANCYIKKPIDFAGFLHVIRQIEDFWFSVTRLPGFIRH